MLEDKRGTKAMRKPPNFLYPDNTRMLDSKKKSRPGVASTWWIGLNERQCLEREWWGLVCTSVQHGGRHKEKEITARATRRKTEGEQEGNKEMSTKATSSVNNNSFHISKG